MLANCATQDCALAQNDLYYCPLSQLAQLAQQLAQKQSLIVAKNSSTGWQQLQTTGQSFILCYGF